MCGQVLKLIQRPCPHHLLCPHLPPFLLQRSPRVRLCSCLASVARAKERRQMMVLPLPHQLCLLKPISPFPAAAQQCFGEPRGRGPRRLAIDSTTNSCNHGIGRALGDECIQTAHEHQHEDPSRSWREHFVERCENRPTWTAIHEVRALQRKGALGIGRTRRPGVLCLPRLTRNKGGEKGPPIICGNTL